MTLLRSNRSIPRILFITSHGPEGQDHGARLRVRHLLLQMTKFAEVRLVLAGAYEEFSGQLSPTPSSATPSEVFDFHPWEIGSWWDRLRLELGSDYLNTNRGRASLKDQARLAQLIKCHDLVWIHGMVIANGFGLWKWPKSILDIDDIPSSRTWSEMTQESRPLSKLQAIRKYFLWKRQESRIFERFDALTVCSEPDRSYFGNSERAFVIPNGFDAPYGLPARKPSHPARIGFIGSLEYPANEKGLRWFLGKVWPRILDSNPSVVLRLVGRNSMNPEWLAARNVEGLGWVADADAEMATWAFTIVPVFEGGGTRVKISNAFSRHCPVVSTALGAYGYEVTSGCELLIGNSVDEFTSCCCRMLQDDGLAEQLAANAWQAFQRNWSWDAIGQRLEEAVGSVIKRTSGAPKDST